MDSVIMVLHYHNLCNKGLYTARCLRNKWCIHIDSTRYMFCSRCVLPLYTSNQSSHVAAVRVACSFFQCTAQVIFNEHMRLPAVKIREPSTLQCESQYYFKRSSFHVCKSQHSFTQGMVSNPLASVTTARCGCWQCWMVFVWLVLAFTLVAMVSKPS